MHLHPRPTHFFLLHTHVIFFWRSWHCHLLESIEFLPMKGENGSGCACAETLIRKRVKETTYVSGRRMRRVRVGCGRDNEEFFRANLVVMVCRRWRRMRKRVHVIVDKSCDDDKDKDGDEGFRFWQFQDGIGEIMYGVSNFIFKEYIKNNGEIVYGIPNFIILSFIK